jgi:chromate transport protein ChrA
VKNVLGGLLIATFALVLPPIFAIISARWCFALLDTNLVWVKMMSGMAMGFSTGVFSSYLSMAIPSLFDRSEDPEKSQSFIIIGCVSLIICGTLSLFTSGLTVLMLSRSRSFLWLN